MIYLYESQSIPNELVSHIQNTPLLYTYFDINFKGIKPKNYCGFLFTNDESYFIIPKIADENTQNLNTFIYMFMYAYDINLKNEDLMNGNSKNR
jgi:5-methylcytosine-specific restriction enzyme subunit McrC